MSSSGKIKKHKKIFRPLKVGDKYLGAMYAYCKVNEKLDYFDYEKKLDELKSILISQIPAIADSSVNIVKIARRKGVHTKVLLTSKTNINCIGAVLGQENKNLERIRESLGKETIQFIEYRDDEKALIKSIFFPKNKQSLDIGIESNKDACNMFLKDKHLMSRAIGKNGVNVNLAEKLLGKRIYISLKPSS